MTTEFGRRLAKARDHAGLTQDELAAAADMAQSTLAHAEKHGHGSRKTPQLAAACGVNAHWLATGEGQMLAPASHTAATPIAQYRVQKTLSADDLIEALGAVLARLGPQRQVVVSMVLAKFATDPKNDAMAAELVQLLKAPDAQATKHRRAR
ncbi:MAG: helix-turn-helix transcriptional regulator [Burkholderiales bacterium]|nr:helix-turn-helix transcriptional regulator [Burkholderiales bacterium]